MLKWHSTCFLQFLNCPLHIVGRYFKVEKEELPEKGYLFPFTRANFCHQNNRLSPSEKQLKSLRSSLWKIYLPPPLGSASISCVLYYNILTKFCLFAGLSMTQYLSTPVPNIVLGKEITNKGFWNTGLMLAPNRSFTFTLIPYLKKSWLSCFSPWSLKVFITFIYSFLLVDT